MNRKNIAIFGSSGHIGSNLIFYLREKQEYNLYLFTRDKIQLQKYDSISEKFRVRDYKNFENEKLDVIINSIGMGDPGKLNEDVLKITEFYDKKIIDYLEDNKSSTYINFSSGSIYGQNFKNPVTDNTITQLDVNHIDNGYLYSIAKIYSETKHRLLNHLNIVDLRIFGFYSRFIDLKSKFFMAEVTSSIKNQTDLAVDKAEIIRDFVHPKEFCSLIEKCFEKKSINDAFDVYSKNPISKFEILEKLVEKYDLKFHVVDNTDFICPTGIKEKYYSMSRKAKMLNFNPKYSSLDTILDEIKFIVE